MSFLAPVLLLGLGLASCTSAAHGTPRPWNRVVLLELFTSQGCSSCPAADVLVKELPGTGRTKSTHPGSSGRK